MARRGEARQVGVMGSEAGRCEARWGEARGWGGSVRGEVWQGGQGPAQRLDMGKGGGVGVRGGPGCARGAERRGRRKTLDVGVGRFVRV